MSHWLHAFDGLQCWRHTGYPGMTAYHMHYHCVPHSPITSFHTENGALGYLDTEFVLCNRVLLILTRDLSACDAGV